MGNTGFDDALRDLARTAQRIAARRAALRHDLMGRIYHRLLADQKFLGAYYTTIPAATMLLRLTMDRENWRTDWSDVEQVKRLRIADLACGTGTLLKAALQAVADNHVRARAERGEHPDLAQLQQGLVELVLWGFDVVPFAIHLAGSALALHQPDVKFHDMNLRTLPVRGIAPAPGRRGRLRTTPSRLGSLDLLHGRTIEVEADLFGQLDQPEQITGAGERTGETTLPPLDLCVMNPPFTRSVGGNALFGQITDERERAILQSELKRIVQEQGVSANITAGLGSVFVGMAHPFVKEGGFLSLVLPRALLTGVAWEPTRTLIGQHYFVRYVIVSHEPGHWNFSENTSLSECLIVAQKLRSRERPGQTKVVNLWKKPATSIEALGVADQVRRTSGASIESPSGVSELGTIGEKTGEVILVSPDDMRAGRWGEAAAFSQTDLCRCAHALRAGRLHLPGAGAVGAVPMTTVDSLGVVGPDRRDLHDGFSVSAGRTAYPAFWGHPTESVQQLGQNPTAYLAPLAHALPGRHLRDATLLWSRAGHLLVAERIRLNTAHVLSVYLPQQVLSNTLWPVAIANQRRIPGSTISQILCLWLNSTLGVLSVVAARVDTEGAFVSLKKPILEQLPVLNPLAISARARRSLAAGYARLRTGRFLALPKIAEDPLRAELDSLILSAVGIDADLGPLRERLAAEPIFPA